VTDWSIWPATNGPSTDAGDAADISRGVIFRLSATGWLKAIRFYRGTANVGNHTGGAPIGGLYTVADGLPVAGTDVTFTLSGTGWQTATLVTPVQLNPNVSYKAAVLSGNYTATGHYFDTGAGVGGIVNGILTAPDAGGNPSGIGSIQQGSYRQPTAGLQYPNQYFQGGNYWVDVTVADEDPGSDIRDVTGSVAVPALVLGATDVSKIGLASPSLPVSAELTAGDVAKVSDIAVSLPVAVTLSASDVMKIVDDAVSLPVSVVLSAQAQAIGAGVNAPTSEVLCSSWANWLDVPQRMKDKLPDLTEAEWQINLMRASELLWMLSGRRWYGGGCTETATLRSWPPMQGNGSWPYHRSWGRCGCWMYATWLNGVPHPGDYSGHHIGAPMAIKLPRAPLTNIVSVTIDGDAFTSFEMIRNGWIERVDGQPWAVCGGETVITYQYGEAPPAGGKQAAIDLAYELGREQTGDDKCRLPSTTVSVTRQGVTIQRQTADEYQALQRTGLPEVDRWLAAVNPRSHPARARVWSPDIPSAIRTPQ
jgi:hypothetical protein